jgi:hypothetical protein
MCALRGGEAAINRTPDRRFRVAIIRMGHVKGIGIEEYTAEEHPKILYFASLYLPNATNKQAFLYVCYHILSHINSDQTALIRIYDRKLFAARREWFDLFPQLIFKRYKTRGDGPFKDCYRLAIDALDRKSNITEKL